MVVSSYHDRDAVVLVRAHVTSAYYPAGGHQASETAFGVRYVGLVEFRGVDAPEATPLAGLPGCVGGDGVAVEHVFNPEGDSGSVGYPASCVVVIYFQEACHGVVGVVAESFGHVWLELRGYAGPWFRC